MVYNINSLLKNKIFINGMWLYILQIFNTVLPLLTLPYITRILGSSQYGVFSFSLTFVTYFQVIVEYGFNLSGSRKLALASNQEEKSRIFTRITMTKLILCVISFIIMIVTAFLLGLNEKQLYLILILFTIVIGTAIQQVWLFQGLQVMKYITIINVLSRTLSVLLIFLLIRDSTQVYLYSVLYAVTFLFNGILSATITRYKLKIQFTSFSFKDIINELKDGWHIFTTSAMSVVFSGIGVTVLGFSNSDSTIGVYSAIQKVPYIMIMMFSPIGQAIFPRISQKFSNSFDDGIKSVTRILSIILPIIGIVSFIMIMFSSSIVNLIYGKQYSAYHSLMLPLVLWFFLSILNNFLGIQSLVSSGYQKEYGIAFRISVIAIVILNILLGYNFGAYGVAYATMFSEFILTLSLVYQLNKVKSKIRRNYSTLY
ncbi:MULTISPECIES: flippase [Priestia]|uniref:flippase n=1 Tax=Priestia TaxID=2800373 RepID=UPI001C52B03C|nr:flippase [Priestia megaterium]MBW0932041.1 flippase [Priestia megaterium]